MKHQKMSEQICSCMYKPACFPCIAIEESADKVGSDVLMTLVADQVGSECNDEVGSIKVGSGSNDDVGSR